MVENNAQSNRFANSVNQNLTNYFIDINEELKIIKKSITSISYVVSVE